MNTEITTQDTKLSTLSDKYRLVKTRDIAQKFRDMGFTVDKYQEAKVRNKSKQGFQKHLVSLSNPTLLSSIHSDTKLQVLVTNSHDGTNALTLQLGVYRFCCANGLIIGSTFEKVKLRHTGMILEQVEESILRIVSQAKKLDETLTAMKTKVLTREESQAFIERAVKLRYENKTASDISFPVLRTEDDQNNVFALYNRVQEHLVNGGNDVRNSRNQTRAARRLTNITALVKLNENLFDLANEFALAA